jgi:hypothetical protein
MQWLLLVFDLLLWLRCRGRLTVLYLSPDCVSFAESTSPESILLKAPVRTHYAQKAPCDPSIYLIA